MSPATNFSSSSSSSSRWCPTPEQLMILEEMYKAGIRTPNSSQIQHITAQLSYYGRIEGKNVFYWFQNHKARDRQKLRRKICKQLQQQQELYLQNNYHHHHLHRQQELMLNQQSLLGFLPLPAASLLHQQYHSSPPPFFPQVGGEDAFINSHTWKVHHEISAERAEMEKKSLMNMYGHDWMMTMMDVGPTNSSPSCHSSSTGSGATNTTRVPLKTLQLFPVTSTNLKAADEDEEESRPCLETM